MSDVPAPVVTAPTPSAPAPAAASFKFDRPAAGATPPTPPITAAAGDKPAPTGEPAAPEGEPKVQPPKADSPAAIKLAARNAKEARDAKSQLAKVQAELTAAKAAGTNTTDAQATLDAIKKNPSLLFQHGWDADKLLAKILAPDEVETPGDPKVQALADEVKALKEAKEAETKAAKEAEEKAATAKVEAETKQAHANVAKMIGETSETHFLVDADDAPDITTAVVAYCEAEGFAPTTDEAKNLVAQAVRQLHEHREKRFGGRLARPAASAAPKAGVSAGPGFREPRQQQHRPPAQQTPSTSITSSQGPLPTAAPKYVPSFR